MKDFLIRNKNDIKLVKEKKMEGGRRRGFTEDVRCGWFNNLKEVLNNNGLIYKPRQIFNVDESGFADDTKCK
jgi:hypothetical protein